MTKGKGKAPGFGGLSKHVKTKEHKERAQPAARKHLGALEKHKDYVKRATRRHDKVKRLHELKRAAANRNPDEYNPKMTKTLVDPMTGKMRERLEKGHKSKVMLKELATNQKDVRYLRFKADSDERKAKQLLSETSMLDAAPKNTHIIYVDDEDDVATLNVAEYLDTSKEMLRRPANMARKTRIAKLPLSSQDEDALEYLERKKRQRTEEASSSARKKKGTNDDGGEEEEGEEEKDEDARLIKNNTSHLLDDNARRDAALKYREIAQRLVRSKNLKRLVNKTEKRNQSIRNAVNCRKNLKFKRGANVRAS